MKEFRETIEVLRASNQPEAWEAISELARDLYDPDIRLNDWVNELEGYDRKKSLSKAEQQRAGHVLEGIALVSFYRIKGANSLKSYRAPDAQHDLLITGNSGNWIAFCDYCRINSTKRGVLIEAKAHRKPVSSSQFSRVCSNIDHTTLKGLVSLGVIFSLRGATGFPASTSDEREITLRDARLRQAVFFLITEVPVIVFDMSDLKQLSTPGALPDLVERKVKELFMQSGQIASRATDHCPLEIDVPDYLVEFKPL
jgi:hypothetical protein